MRLDLLSRYRTQLMGLAMLWIMFFHSSLPIEEGAGLLFFFKRVGYGGVDIFMFLSGFGVYYAVSKSESVVTFYKKRALRILPYYYPIVLVFSVLCLIAGMWTFMDVINNLLLTGFWLNRGLNHMFDWYIPALVFLYLITPLFYYFFKKNKWITTLGFIVAFVIFIYSTERTFSYLFNFSFRAPLYFSGFWLADFLKNHREFKISPFFSVLFFIMLVSGICLLYYWYAKNAFHVHGQYLLPFFLITFPLCLFLSYLFSLFKNYKFPVLYFFGTYTLTLYIFHERILRIGEIIFYLYAGKWISGTVILIMFNIVVFAITIILAVVWQKFIDKKISKYKYQ